MPNRVKAEEKAEIVDRRRKIAALILSKHSVIEIERKLHVPRNTIYRDLEVIKSAWRRDTLEDVSSVIARDLAALAADEGKLRRRWDTIADTDVWLRCHKQIIVTMERRAKMQGLDAPEEVNLDVSTLNEIITLLLAAVVPYVPAEKRNALADQVEAIRARYAV
jgi:hypothetical protein